MDEQKIAVTFYQSTRHMTGDTVDVPWGALVEALSEVREVDCAPCLGAKCDRKSAMLWAPTRNIAGDRRRVEAVSALVLDVDGVAREEFDGILARLSETAYVAYSTHSHVPERLHAHIVLPLVREVVPDVAARLQVSMGNRLKLSSQRERWDSRVWYRPTRPRGAEYFARESRGAFLDVEAFS